MKSSGTTSRVSTFFLAGISAARAGERRRNESRSLVVVLVECAESMARDQAGVAEESYLGAVEECSVRSCSWSGVVVDLDVSYYRIAGLFLVEASAIGCRTCSGGCGVDLLSLLRCVGQQAAASWLTSSVSPADATA